MVPEEGLKFYVWDEVCDVFPGATNFIKATP